MNLRRYSGWMWLIGSLLAVAILSAIANHPSPQAAPLSLASPQASGGLALSLWLQRAGYPVLSHKGTTVQLPSEASTAVLLPTGEETSASQTAALLRWVRGGGHVVLISEGDSSQQLLSALGLRIVPVDGADVQMTQPLLQAPPASEVEGTADAVLAGIPPGASLAETRFGTVLLREGYGRGTIWVLTAPDLLDNAHIQLSNNRELLLNLVGPRGTTVAFESAQAAAAPSGADWLTGSPWGVSFLFALAVLLLYRGLSGWRLGAPLAPETAYQRPAAEYVVSLANLLQSGRRRQDVLRIYQRRFQRTLVERYGEEGLSSIEQTGTGIDGRLLATDGSLSESALVDLAAAIIQREEEVRSARV